MFAPLSPDDWTAVLLSLKIALVAVCASLIPGIALAYVLAKKEFWGKTLLDGFVHLPLVLPPVVTGYFLLLEFGRRGPLGMLLLQAFDFTFAFRWTGAALASAIMGFPLMVRAMRLSFEAVDPKLEAAASSLGANPFLRFLLVSLPLALPGVISGAILSFAKALGEFGATITFVSNIPGETRTIASAIYTNLQTPDGDASAMRLTLVAIVISMAALIASEFLQRRSLAKRARA
ncbi:molybdate ABC transporter permease [Methylovirgula sp. 4M-Z18]|uniref:molybdate ABC transporter permease subunit n=1 Tax=Methylovirgula sp. 4M-Z18 TaxID=2293567 RepID=UPI000E2F93DB|nr:molybdate ABC transporter permease subunit [Methylovirgula sp. 4M-Z18]RFB79487.1 molybdate ABC transporter permease [Methylovirgula sp. 4M-Z18]